MANVILSKGFYNGIDVDGSVRTRAYDFLSKLSRDHTLPGLHIEPIANSVDSRVRTGRVSDNYRAVLFLVDDGAEPVFVLAAIKKHDEANRLAERIELRVNPINGVLEMLESTTPAEVSPPREVLRVDRDSSRQPILNGYTYAELVEGLGIGESVARAALAASTDDALLAAVELAPTWQGEAVLSLATGTSLADVRAQLMLGRETAPHREASIAEQITAAAEQPAAQMDFVLVQDDEELRRVLAGSFDEWRVFLHPEQRRFAYQPTNGSFRLAGGAGTGKTVVALHRARYLARRAAFTPPRIVLTTYSTTLADNLRRDLAKLDPDLPLAASLGEPGIYVAGVDKLAREALSSADPAVARQATSLAVDLRALSPLTDRDDRTMWEQALRQAGVDLERDLARVSFLAAEYRNVVLAKDATTRERYARVSREGRGVRLGRAQRLAVWHVIEAYRRGLEMTASVTFAELASISARALALRAETGGRLADHVIVDEAQDLHSGHLLLLRALVADGADDLFICEDSHQRIYREKVVLSRLGIHIRGRSRRLTLNYRTTRQNLAFALGLLAGTPVTDLDDEPEDVSRYRSTMTGPAPRLVQCETLTEELDQVAGVLCEWAADPAVEPSSIAVLVRSAAVSDRVARGLTERGISIRAGTTGNQKTPRLLTMHRAKGLEFSRVVLAGVDETQLPAHRVLADQSEDDRADAALRERFLLYVAASRARDQLVVTWHGKPSPFLANADQARS
jgi:superfamily I DNA/RNA helicase